MVEHIQTIRRQKLANCLSVFDNFVGLVLKALRLINQGYQLTFENLRRTSYRHLIDVETRSFVNWDIEF